MNDLPGILAELAVLDARLDVAARQAQSIELFEIRDKLRSLAARVSRLKDEPTISVNTGGLEHAIDLLYERFRTDTE